MGAPLIKRWIRTIASAKRYRHTGMERDAETGLGYHRARYYAAWLGRWISTDPAGLIDGQNLYCRVSDNPIQFTDPTGTGPMDSLIYADEKALRFQGDNA